MYNNTVHITFPKNERLEHNEDILDQIRKETSRATPNLIIPYLTILILL